MTIPVLFHDYDEEDCSTKSLNEFLIDNKTDEKIKNIKIVINNTSPCMSKKGSLKSNISPIKCDVLSDIRPAIGNRNINHAVVIIETLTGGEGEHTESFFWTFEKNCGLIAVQRSSKLQMLISKILGDDRATALTYDRRIEDGIMKKHGAENIDVNDILLFVSQLENKVVYNWNDDNFNCNGFSKRIIKYIQNEDVRKNCSLFKILYKKYIYLTVKLRKCIDFIYFDIFDKFDGTKINIILKQIENAYKYNSDKIEEYVLPLVTYYRQDEDVKILYYDHGLYTSVTCDLVSYLKGDPDVGEIKKVKIFCNDEFQKNSKQERKYITNGPDFICNNTVIIIETIITKESNQSETFYWSIDKNDKYIIIQKSKDIKVLLTNLRESDRPSELKYDKDVEKHYTENIDVDNVDKVKMIDLLDLIWKHESQHYHILPHFLRCQNFTKRMINYIYKQDMGTLSYIWLKMSELVNFVWKKDFYYSVHISYCINKGIDIITLTRKIEGCITTEGPVRLLKLLDLCTAIVGLNLKNRKSVTSIKALLILSKELSWCTATEELITLLKILKLCTTIVGITLQISVGVTPIVGLMILLKELDWCTIIDGLRFLLKKDCDTETINEC